VAGRVFYNWVLFFLFIGLAGSSVLRAENEPVPTGTNSGAIEVPRTGEIQEAESLDDFDREFEEDFGELDEESTLSVADPLEPINRGFFWFNDKLYFYVMKPVVKVYRVVPEPARQSVSNFFSNLFTPVRFGSSLLQLKVKDSGNEVVRLVINTTLGIGGLFDPADKWFKIKKKEEDFGQVLGHYGAGPGFYIVWPFFGPSSVRDTVGMVGDGYMSPLYNHFIDTGHEFTFEERALIKGFEFINELSLDRDTYELIKRDSLDPYTTIRNGYIQRREGQIEK
jgi:phospholipid-binding lipoprotein MlaA